jgi:hypothetical protein
MKKQYVIKDNYHDNEMFLYISDDTTSLEDIWQKLWMKKEPKDSRYTPKLFDDIKEAKRYLKEIKRKSTIEWKENEHLYRVYGKNKYQWDVYEHKI